MKATFDYDYTDCYAGYIHDQGQPITGNDLGKAFLLSAPRWARNLMFLRDAAMRLIGLKTSGNRGTRARAFKRFMCEPGQQIGLFKVLRRTGTEIVLGQVDWHLNFRLSLFTVMEKDNCRQRLTIRTDVKFKNFFGRLYFSAVKPFHRLIVRRMLTTMIKTLEANIDNKARHSI